MKPRGRMQYRHNTPQDFDNLLNENEEAYCVQPSKARAKQRDKREIQDQFNEMNETLVRYLP